MGHFIRAIHKSMDKEERNTVTPLVGHGGRPRSGFKQKVMDVLGLDSRRAEYNINYLRREGLIAGASGDGEDDNDSVDDDGEGSQGDYGGEGDGGEGEDE